MDAHTNVRTAILLAAALPFTLSSLGRAQVSCRDWSSEFSAPGVNGSILALHVWDDGTGPALYMGGSDFQIAGENVVNAIARWDGSSWTGLSGPSGTGLTGLSYDTVEALLDYDDGSGSALYATGLFWEAGGVSVANIARYDGTQWSDVGGGLGPAGYSALRGWDLEIYDDGSGEALYLAGGFGNIGGVSVEGLARWDGSAWSTVGGQSFHIDVRAIQPFDDGSGEKLYVGGSFEAMWGSPSDYIACWDGSSWSGLPPGALGVGQRAWVQALEVFDDGGGEALYVGGHFQTSGGAIADNVLKWDGTSWSPVGAGPGFPVEEFLIFDDGSGPALYAAGDEVARWDGASWTPVGDGLNNDVRALEPFDDGSGTRLFAGGLFTSAGNHEAWGLASLDGATWEPLASGQGLLNVPSDMVEFDDGSGLRLFVDTQFGTEGGYASVAAWDGSSVGPGPGGSFDGEIYALGVYDDGSGPKIHAGGSFTTAGAVAANNVARWSGTSWEALGSGVDDIVRAMTLYDDGSGPVLVLGGKFKWSGAVNVKRVATWDGTDWTPLGGGITGLGAKTVFALDVYDDGLGSGPALFAAGRFQNVEGNPAENIARWDGTSWSPLGSGTNDQIYALRVHDDGSGPSLFVGGEFWSAGGLFARRVAKWNGLTWARVGNTGNELVGTVNDLAALDLGAGLELVAVGSFKTSLGSPGNYVATWNGSTWSPLPVEPDGWVTSVAAHDDKTGAGPSLFLGGVFERFGATPSIGIGRWRVECPCPPAVYCTAKVNSQGCTPTIFATGTPSLFSNSLRVKASNVLNNKAGLLFWGHTPGSTPFQGGTKCVVSPTVRTPVQQSGGNPPPDDRSGFYSFHWNKPYIQSKALTPGDTVHCQYWSRDPQSASTTGLTDALTFTLCP